MAGLTVAQAEQHLNEWLSADSAVAKGQAYSLGGRTRTKKVLYVKTCNRNEALDLTVYCHAGLFALQHFKAPAIYRDLGRLAQMVQQGQSPETLAGRVRRVRSSGLI